MAVSLALAYYGAVTVLPQIETWYFLSSITVGPQLLPRLFVMGIPTAFLFVPTMPFIVELTQRQERHGVAAAASQAVQPGRRAVDGLHLQVALAQAVLC